MKSIGLRGTLSLFLAAFLAFCSGCGMLFAASSPALSRADLQGTWAGRTTDSSGNAIILEWGFDGNEYHALSYYRDRDEGMLETGTFTMDGAKMALTGEISPLFGGGRAEAVSYTVECGVGNDGLTIKSGANAVTLRKTSHSDLCLMCAVTGDNAPVETPSSSEPDTSAEPDPVITPEPSEEPDPGLTPRPSAEPEPDEEPEPDPQAEAEARRRAFSEEWKRAVYNRAREFHEELVQSVPEKHEFFGEWYDNIEYVYSVFLYDAMHDAPNLVLSDSMFQFMMSLTTLYSVNGGMLEEIVTAQWITPLVNIMNGRRDMVEATWTGGGTWSESRYYRYVGGAWRQESFFYETGGGQFFTDEATGEFSDDWDESERLLGERLKNHRYLPFEDLHFIEFDYATTDGMPVPWTQIAPKLSAFLDEYDGIYINVSYIGGRE